MVQIPDDPIIRRIEKSGYPPWFGKRNGETDAQAQDIL